MSADQRHPAPTGSGGDGTAAAERPARWSVREMLCAAVVVTALAAVLVGSMWWKSPTVDEYAHVPAGLRALRHSDLELYGKTPPLARELYCLPALAAGPELPPPPPGNRMAGWYPWRYADRFFAANLSRHGLGDTHGLFRRARLGVVAMCLLLAVAVLAWARTAWGPAAGLAALGFLAVEPNLLAHGRLATTDVPLALGFTAAVALAVAALARPRPATVLAAGLAAGAALASKHTAILIAPVWLGLAAIETVHRLLGRRDRPWLPAAVVAGAGAVALTALAAAYGFHGVGSPLRGIPLASGGMQRIAASPIGALPLPLPELWIEGFDAQRADLEYVEWPNYLLGRWSADGWWYYYPLALAMKSPLGSLAAMAVVILAAARRGWRRARAGVPGASDVGRLTTWAVVLSLAVVLGAATLTTAVQTGVRWILPAIPFLALAIGSLTAHASRRVRRAVAACWLLAAVEVAAVHPHYLAFFNRAAGGPELGWRRLASSNVDWGQDLVYLRRELARRGLADIRLAYFGHPDPAAYGLAYTVPLPGASGADAVRGITAGGRLELAPGWYAVSVNHLLGHPYVINDHGRWISTGSDRHTAHDLFGALRERPPEAVVGGSVLLYRVDE